MEKIYKIYRILNKITGRCYIGQTGMTIKQRWSSHCSPVNNAYIHRSIKKYGTENFTIEWIASAITIDFIDELEVYFILSNNSLVPNGYNLKTGGVKSRLSEEAKKAIYYRPITAINPKTKDIIHYDNQESSVIDGHAKSVVSMSINGKLRRSKGYHFFRTNDHTIEEMFALAEQREIQITQSKLDGRKKAVHNMKDHIDSQKKQIIGIHIKTFEYQIFESLTDARIAGYSTSAICKSLKGEKRTSKKHYFQEFTESIHSHIKNTKDLF